MRPKISVSLVLLLLLMGTGASLLRAQAPARLVADNRTAYVANIYVWNGRSWNFVSRLNAKSWTAFPNVAAGSKWRATIGQVTREHVVRFVWDPSYGGYQSVWLIQ